MFLKHFFLTEKLKQIPVILICIAIPLTIGGISGLITSKEIDGWYSNLIKPSFNPPNNLFGPVWTFLYLLMGISLYIIWSSEKTNERKKALAIFILQLFLNFCWSILFFSFHWLLVAFIEIIILWSIILFMITLFKKISPSASFINIPYLLWVSFATLLNGSVWWLNK